jgi:hypothetical protein
MRESKVADIIGFNDFMNENEMCEPSLVRNVSPTTIGQLRSIHVHAVVSITEMVGLDLFIRKDLNELKV